MNIVHGSRCISIFIRIPAQVFPYTAPNGRFGRDSPHQKHGRCVALKFRFNILQEGSISIDPHHPSYRQRGVSSSHWSLRTIF